MHKKTVIDFKELGERYTFTDPIKELKTNDFSEVEAILDQVSAYQDQGYYVVGYLSYEAAKAFEPLFAVKSAPLAGEYLAYFTVHEQVEKSPFPLDYEAVNLPENWEDFSSQEAYVAAIGRIREEIRQGNTYQVNHTTRLTAQVEADSFAIYNRLMVEQGAGYNAFIQHDEVRIISASPELFFKVEGNRLITRPMKGTTQRGVTLVEDRERKSWLAQDPKNRAENMMIVDLLRNDMGRLCEVGTVQVTKLCAVEQYSTVWQMTSTIEGQLQRQKLPELFKALFPCGSITGAPKIATMSVINQLETSPRGVYCGAIGICLPNGDALFNVPIRTMQLQVTTAFYGVGGGITWDSRWQDEYQEIKQKTAILHRQQPRFDLITTALVAEGRVTFLEEHLNRLQEAASYFAYPFDREQMLTTLKTRLADLDGNAHRLRLALEKSGQIKLEVAELEELPRDFLKAKLTERDVEPSPHLYFKTSHRPHIPFATSEQIFHSSAGVLQETAIGNLILERDGRWLTPKISDGCLPGIYRQYLLHTGRLVERTLTLDDLTAADRVLACNALRGVYELDIREM